MGTRSAQSDINLIYGSVSYYREYFRRFVIPCIVRTEGCYYCGYWSENCGCDARDF